MKTRSGFVSNSSSTSYIVAILKPKDKCPTCGICISDLLDVIGNFSRDDDDLVIDGQEELQFRINEIQGEIESYTEDIENPLLQTPSYGNRTAEEWRKDLIKWRDISKQRLEEFKGYIEKYDNISSIRISNHVQGLHSLLSVLETYGVIKILEKDDL